MKKILSLLAFVLSLCTYAQTLISHNYLSTSTASQLAILSPKASFNVDLYKITYHTTDINGNPTVASGAVAVPHVTSTCNTFPLGAYCHGTVVLKADVPSNNNSESLIGKLLASTGYVYTMPDYLGLGDNLGLHPYLHAQTEATATLDALKATRELIDTLNATAAQNIALTDSLVLTGYSQGGHAAMATFKYIQDNNLYTDYNVIAAAPASGPYNLSGSQAAVLTSDQPYSNPAYVFYLIMGLNQVYGNIYNSPSDIFKAPYDTLIPPYFNGNYPIDSINAKLPLKLSDFMQDTVLANFKNDSVNKTHPLWQALIANDNYDWNPQRPLRMYYCTADEQVDYRNSLVAKDSMNAQGATDVQAVFSGNLNHFNCIFSAILGASNFADTLSGGCSYNNNISITEAKSPHFKLYPNPVQNTLHIEGVSGTSATLTMFNLSGKMVAQWLDFSGSVSISHLPEGVYLLKLTQDGQSWQTKMIKTN